MEPGRYGEVCSVSFLIFCLVLRGFRLTMGNPQGSFILYSRYNYHNSHGLTKINCMVSMFFFGGPKVQTAGILHTKVSVSVVGHQPDSQLCFERWRYTPHEASWSIYPRNLGTFWVVNVGFSPAFHHNQHRIWPFHKRYIHYYWVVVSSIFFLIFTPIWGRFPF